MRIADGGRVARHERARTRSWQHRRKWRWPLLGFGVVVLVGLAGAAWLAWDAKTVRDELVSAAADVSTLRDIAEQGRADPTVLADLQQHATAAHRATGHVPWLVARRLPWVGAQVRAVQSVTAIVDSLAQTALPPLVDAVTTVDPAKLAPKDGRVDLAPLEEVAPQVIAADDAVKTAAAKLAAIETSHLVRQVASGVEALRDAVSSVAPTVATAAKAAVLLPAMLGADGPRTYLVLVQNNAELRATGGLAGAVLALQVDEGTVALIGEKAGGSLQSPGPVLPLTDAELALFDPHLGTDMRDVNFTPDFPRTAALAAGIWKQQGNGTVDGVLSVDPVVLSLVLKATGPVTLLDGTQLAADNAVETLLNQVYFRFPDPQAQDAYFAAAAGAVFSAVLGGQGDADAAVDALAEAARQGRLMVWSARDDEQARLSGTVLSGELRGSQGDSPVIGVYLNDGTQAKLDYYLDVQTKATATTCTSDGSQGVDLTITLTSKVPADGSALPDYVTGTTGLMDRGSIMTNVLIYAPTRGEIALFRVNSSETSAFTQVHRDLQVAATTVDLDPGQTAVLSVRVVSGPSPGDVLGRQTPTSQTSGTWRIPSACR